MGWPSQSYLQSAVDVCTNESGMIEDCPVFNLQSTSLAQQCFLRTPAVLAAEAVSTNLANLPGHVAIQIGPQPATFGSSTPVPSSTGSALPESGAGMAAQVFPQSTLSPSTTSAGLAVAITSSPSETYVPVKTEYITSGVTVEELIFVAPVGYKTSGVAVTETPSASAASARKRRHLHGHAHRYGAAHI
jgi:hypothetical protein